MLRVVSLEDKESIREVSTLNLDVILALLSKSMLRVHGFRRPINEKTKEVNANLQVKPDLDAVKRRVSKLEQQVKDLKAKLEPLKEVEREADCLRTRVDKLKQRLAYQEVQLTKKYTYRAEKEKQALVKDMMDDCNIIMEMTWVALFPDASYEGWKNQFAASIESTMTKSWAKLKREKRNRASRLIRVMGLIRRRNKMLKRNNRRPKRMRLLMLRSPLLMLKLKGIFLRPDGHVFLFSACVFLTFYFYRPRVGFINNCRLYQLTLFVGHKADCVV